MCAKRCFIKIVLITILCLVLTNSALGMEDEQYSKTIGQVLETQNFNDANNNSIEKQLIKVKALSGPFSGQVFQMRNSLLTNPWPHVVLVKGDKVVLTLEEKNGQIVNAYLSDFGRADALYFLIGAFVVLLVLIGGLKGL